VKYVAAGFFGTLLAMAIAVAAEPIQPIFVPVIVVYKAGGFQTVQLSGDEWFTSLRDCKDAADKEAMKVIESDTGDLSVKVACLPVPSKNPKVDAQ
jgi:hypothetical protein